MTSQSEKSGARLFKQVHLFGKIRYIVMWQRYNIWKQYKKIVGSAYKPMSRHIYTECPQWSIWKAVCNKASPAGRQHRCCPLLGSLNCTWLLILITVDVLYLSYDTILSRILYYINLIKQDENFHEGVNQWGSFPASSSDEVTRESAIVDEIDQSACVILVTWPEVCQYPRCA